MNWSASFACVILLFMPIAAVDPQSFLDDPIIGGIITDLACKVVDCGQGGTCVAAPNATIPVKCECAAGSVEPVIGNLTLPACIPNCTTDFTCGGSAPAPPFPSLPTLLNPSDPCFMTICIQGTCVPQEKGHICQCTPGANNLFGNLQMSCFNNCVLDANCDAGFTNQPPPPPPPSASTRHGPNGVASSGIQHSLTLLLLVAVSLSTL